MPRKKKVAESAPIGPLEDEHIPPPKDKIIVEITREWDGQIYSQVRLDNPDPRKQRPVVIDRVKGRMMSVDTVRSRAQSLATLLEVELREDLEWRCLLDRKVVCHCPKCISEGRG